MSRSEALPAVTAETLRWSVLAGLYFLACGSVALSVLSPVTRTLTAVLGLPAGYALPVLAAPVSCFGAVAWGALVERGRRYTYVRGAVTGLVTAAATVAVWVVAGAVVWGSELVLVGGVVVLFVLAVSVPAGVVSGLPLVYVRRRRASDR